MKAVIKQGDIREYKTIVNETDVAVFHGMVVHPVCSTFALARDIEWTSRQFILDICGKEEEGVGTFLSIEHKGPAFVGEELQIIAQVDSLIDNELICSVTVKANNRLVAFGKTGQKILTQEKIDKIFKKV